MPRYYCDYCDTYLTHDSAPGRKQHMRGWKHRENVKLYYDPYVPE
jgi:U1 small nuclear ribonucleoprotein C